MKKIKYILLIIFTIHISYLNLHASERCEHKVKELHDTLVINSQSEQKFKGWYSKRVPDFWNVIRNY